MTPPGSHTDGTAVDAAAGRTAPGTAPDRSTPDGTEAGTTGDRTASAVATDQTPRDAAAGDALWSAIGDPTRRRMLDVLLADGGGTATTLAEHLPVTRQAVAKHLQVLDRVGLVHGSTSGRERRYRVDEAQLARAAAQLDAVGRAWDARLRRIQRLAEAIQQQDPTTTPGSVTEEDD